MLYNSQIEAMWITLSTLSIQGGTRRSVTSRAEYDKVCEAFYQAENCPLYDHSSSDVKVFLAESNIWLYYVGDIIPFPGHSPRLPSPTAAVPLSAFAMRHELRVRRGCFSQLGWNPETGEPWMAIRCYADQGYPALSGLNQEYLFELQGLAHHFLLKFERFVEHDPAGEHQKYILMWPEFKHQSKLMDKKIWKKFNQFRYFLQLWASEPGDLRAPISECYSHHLRSRSYAKRTLPLPGGFVHDYEYYRSFARPPRSLQGQHPTFSTKGVSGVRGLPSMISEHNNSSGSTSAGDTSSGVASSGSFGSLPLRIRSTERSNASGASSSGSGNILGVNMSR